MYLIQNNKIDQIKKILFWINFCRFYSTFKKVLIISPRPLPSNLSIYLSTFLGCPGEWGGIDCMLPKLPADNLRSLDGDLEQTVDRYKDR